MKIDTVFKQVLALPILFFFLPISISCSGDVEKEYAETGIKEELSATEYAVNIAGTSGNLSAIVYHPDLRSGETSPMVILMHGFMSDKRDRVINAVAARLRQANIAYVRFDFNGHGESKGDFQNMTVIKEIEDAQSVYEYVRTLDYVGEIALLGHSQGGVVAGMLAGKLGAERISRLVLMSPAAVLRDNALDGIMFGVRFDPDNIPEYITVFGHRVGRAYLQTAQNLPIYETVAQYTGKICIIHGTEDSIVPYSYGVRFSEDNENAIVHLIEGDDHAFSRYLDEAATTAVEFLSGIGK